jgi:hypothetical protein
MLVITTGTGSAQYPAYYPQETPPAPAAPKKSERGIFTCANCDDQAKEGFLAKLRPSWRTWSRCARYKTLDDFGCTGWRNDTAFVFGSCCDFFGEPLPTSINRPR